MSLHPVGIGRSPHLWAKKRGRGRLCGHDIIRDKEGQYRFSDGTPVDLDDTATWRPCPKCEAHPKNFNGCDPCMANLPGVRNACCGHGRDSAYIEFEDGRIASGAFEIRRREG